MLLIIDKSKRGRDTAAEMFYYMGFLSYPVSPEEAISEISGIYRAVLFNSTDGIADLDDYISRLRSVTDIPFFAMGDFSSPHFRATFSESSYSSTVALGIAKELSLLGREVFGVYQASGFDASADLGEARYLGQIIPLTKTERMILRLLLCKYPEPVTVGDVLKYAYRVTKRPEAASVRTHISIMNKKFIRKFGKALTISEIGRGYSIAIRDLERILEEV